MKNILITGKNGYIGNELENYLRQKRGYEIHKLDMRNDGWRGFDFSKYDCIVHLVGVAHQKETRDNAKLYYRVNRDMTYELAKLAKDANVKHFIYISSMSVYGKISGEIQKDTSLRPNSHYGKSKKEAEALLKSLACDNFQVLTIRAPMVYGKGCKGNFQTLVRLIKKLPFFPKVKNKRSVIYIDNLCEFIKLSIDFQLSGIYCPQDKQYLNTSNIAIEISKVEGKKVYVSRLLGVLIYCLQPFSTNLRKAFGSLIYKETEDIPFSYQIEENGIRKSLMKNNE